MRKTSTPGRLAALLIGLLLPCLPTQGQNAASSAAEKMQHTRPRWAGAGYAADEARLSSTHTANGLEYVYAQQVYRGLPVYNRVVTLVFRGGQLVHHAGSFAGKKQLVPLSSVPAVPASAAVAAAIRPLGIASRLTGALRPTSSPEGPEARQAFAAPGLVRRDIVAGLVWATDASGELHLAWNVNLDLADRPDWLNVRVDAASGAIVDQDNWTVHEVQPEFSLAAPPTLPAPNAARPAAQPSARTTSLVSSAGYHVLPYPIESPLHGAFRAEANPWLKAGAGNAATTHGWHFDGTTDYSDTRGNNVWAYEDADGDDQPGTFGVAQPGSNPLSFIYPPDPAQAPTVATNQNAGLVNLFYWTNITHDLTYQYGFTEAAGNFQAHNLSRGGAANDHIRAESLDGSSRNNANFRTPPDGLSGRMQMFLWNPALPQLQVSAPAIIAGSYALSESTFSPNNKLSSLGPVTGNVVWYHDANGGTHLACGNAVAGTSFANQIVLIDEGTCAGTDKVLRAQNLGARAVILVQSTAGAPSSPGGSNALITTPTVAISRADGARLAAQLAAGATLTVTLPRVTPGPDIDSSLDNGVVVHEYGHGVSNRLTGGASNASCLSNAEQAGEGWSDFLSLMLTTNWATAQLADGPLSRGMGNYAKGYGVTSEGIRSYPYSTSLSINPLTYANVSSNSVHANGTVWCAALWDMTWNIIEQRQAIEPDMYKSTSLGGNVVALRLVMEGLKLQPCQPGFLDARDAILAADELLYGGAHRCAIWRAFARRGMGSDARQGLSTSATDQTAGFALPSGVTLQTTEGPLVGKAFDITLSATCGCGSLPSGYTVVTTLPAGLEYVSSTGGTLVGSDRVEFRNLTFSQEGQTRTFQLQARTATGAGCPVSRPVNDDREANTVGGFTSRTLLGPAGWVASAAHAASGTQSWFASAPGFTTDYTLASASFTPTNLALLTFKHYYAFEELFDGGVVELSTDGGVTWTDAGPHFLRNGYNQTFHSSSFLAGRPCFSGSTVGGGFVQSTIDLSSFAGVPVQVRFRSLTDIVVGGEGWYVDDIQVLDGCGGQQLVQLFNGTQLAATASIRTFLEPRQAPLPVTLLSFNAQWQAAGARLSWATATEQQALGFAVERSPDGATWTRIGWLPAAGNSTTRRDYHLLDAAALDQPAGLLYYRLRQLDQDGTEHFSSVRTLERLAGSAPLLTAQPNPFGPDGLRLTLNLPAVAPGLELGLYDTAGRCLLRRALPALVGAATMSWPEAARLPAGLYLVRMPLPDGRFTSLRVMRE